jgi:hypothetical protein
MTDDDEFPEHKALDAYLADVAAAAGRDIRWAGACELLVRSIAKLRATLDKDPVRVTLYAEHGLDPRRAARTTLVSLSMSGLNPADYGRATNLLVERGWMECYRITKAKGKADEVYRFMVGEPISPSEGVAMKA